MGITIDKHVSVGHIFTTLAAIVAGVSAYANMQNRVYNLEQADHRFELQDKTLMDLINDNRKERLQSFEKIDDKLDKIYIMLLNGKGEK